MQFLLDTHTLIWFFSGHANLSNTVRILMEDTKHQKFISMASIWEMAIKQSKGKLTLSLPLENYIQQKLTLEDFKILAIEFNHVSAIATLPFYHNDPFDRLLYQIRLMGITSGQDARTTKTLELIGVGASRSLAF